MEAMTTDLMETLINSADVYTAKLNDYCQLALKQELSDAEADRLAAFYTEAEADPVLNFLITELDPLLAERLDLLTPETLSRHEDQQAWLREHLEQSLFDQKYRVKAQELLQEQGLYKGPIDGILGQRSCKAFAKFRKTLQQQLQDQGWYRGAIDGELGERSVTALMEFQRSRHLKDDGVPDRKTFVVLQNVQPNRYDPFNTSF